MFRVAASSVRIAAKGVRGAATVSGGSANEFKALRDATKAHAAGESRVCSVTREENERRVRRGGSRMGDRGIKD